MIGLRAIILPAARMAAVLAAFLGGGTLSAQDKPTARIAIGGPSCICYLPTVLAHQLGFYKQAGVEVEMIAL